MFALLSVLDQFEGLGTTEAKPSRNGMRETSVHLLPEYMFNLTNITNGCLIKLFPALIDRQTPNSHPL